MLVVGGDCGCVFVGWDLCSVLAFWDWSLDFVVLRVLLLLGSEIYLHLRVLSLLKSGLYFIGVDLFV